VCDGLPDGYEQTIWERKRRGIHRGPLIFARKDDSRRLQRGQNQQKHDRKKKPTTTTTKVHKSKFPSIYIYKESRARCTHIHTDTHTHEYYTHRIPEGRALPGRNRRRRRPDGAYKKVLFPVPV